MKKSIIELLKDFESIAIDYEYNALFEHPFMTFNLQEKKEGVLSQYEYFMLRAFETYDSVDPIDDDLRNAVIDVFYIGPDNQQLKDLFADAVSARIEFYRNFFRIEGEFESFEDLFIETFNNSASYVDGLIPMIQAETRLEEALSQGLSLPKEIENPYKLQTGSKSEIRSQIGQRIYGFQVDVPASIP